MTTQIINLSSIRVENRKRPIDSAMVAELKKSIEQQGLLQNIGVQQTANGYRLVFGAHRLEAVNALGWADIQARVFPLDASEDECLLAELQENNARKELTGAERKAFAAEVGRLLAKMIEAGQNVNLANGQNESSGHWLVEMANTSGTPFKTLQNWWSAFTKEVGLNMPPKQAGADEKARFFAWLDEQKAKEEAEKAAKAAEAEADKQRKANEAKARRMESEKTDFMDYLDATAQEWGHEIVEEWIHEWSA